MLRTRLIHAYILCRESLYSVNYLQFVWKPTDYEDMCRQESCPEKNPGLHAALRSRRVFWATQDHDNLRRGFVIRTTRLEAVFVQRAGSRVTKIVASNLHECVSRARDVCLVCISRICASPVSRRSILNRCHAFFLFKSRRTSTGNSLLCR